jgi:hypothetical protein
MRSAWKRSSRRSQGPSTGWGWIGPRSSARSSRHARRPTSRVLRMRGSSTISFAPAGGTSRRSRRTCRMCQACQFAITKLRNSSKAALSNPASGGPPRVNNVRRHRDVILLRCACDVRPIFEGGHDEALAVERDTRLAFAIPRGVEQPMIFELLPPIFDLLGVLDNWMDRSVLGTGPEVDELTGELEQHGLIEMRR